MTNLFKILNNKFWTVYSKIYDNLLSMPIYINLLNEITSLVDFKKGEKVLDAGCGTCNFEVMLNTNIKKTVSIEAIDKSYAMLNRASRKNLVDINVKWADLDKRLDYPDNFFHKIVSIHVIYSLADPFYTLKELHRVLKTGGIIIIANPISKPSLFKILKSNFPYFSFFKKLVFILRMFLIIILNLFILGAAKKGIYHFISEEIWKIKMDEIGFKINYIKKAYADQDLLIVAQKL